MANKPYSPHSLPIRAPPYRHFNRAVVLFVPLDLGCTSRSVDCCRHFKEGVFCISYDTYVATLAAQLGIFDFRIHAHTLEMSAKPDAGDAKVTFMLNFVNLDEQPKQMSRSASMCVGELQRFIALKLKSPTVYLFVVNGSEGFVPMPDQTLGDLNLLHGKPDATGSQLLSINVSVKMYLG